MRQEVRFDYYPSFSLKVSFIIEREIMNYITERKEKIIEL